MKKSELKSIIMECIDELRHDPDWDVPVVKQKIKKPKKKPNIQNMSGLEDLEHEDDMRSWYNDRINQHRNGK
jgi:hypothetical protein